MGRTEANNGITRRDFVKGLAAGAAGLGLVSILPGGIISAAAADTLSLIHISEPPQLTPRRRTSAKRGTASILMAWQRI